MRVFNFSAGPSTLALPVLEQAQCELLDQGNAGMSVMEMSHRSASFEKIIHQAEADLRTLMCIPEDYAVLFLQGGASMQFCMVPLNLTVNGSADAINSGNFASLFIKEAGKYTKIREVASSKDTAYNHIPQWNEADFNPEADFFHITLNNTIFGTHFPTLPQTGKVPLVADLSSCILSRPYDVTQYGVIYAGAQKNIAPAGVTIIIIRRDLLERSKESLPAMLNYRLMAEHESMYNTPPCWSIYMAGLTFRWLLDMGGIKEMEKINEAKAKILYDALDASSYYIAPVSKESRSIMNVTFTTPSPETDALFVKEAAAAGLVNIKGHRLVGGMRASIYNAMPIEGVEKLVEFMAHFEAVHV
ncbi:MAG: 3-phosphoserine/phosphohydroxythreonine transaminase [Christensenellales bacterium]